MGVSHRSEKLLYTSLYMYRIRVIAVGNLHNDFAKKAAAEYLTRLTPFAKVTVEEIEKRAFRSLSERERVQGIEGVHLVAHLKNDEHIIVLDEGGKQFDSIRFARYLKDEGERGRTLTFLIGGPLGLSPETKAAAHATLSLSSLTLPHELARVVLLEQLYRAMTILSGKQYHY